MKHLLQMRGYPGWRSQTQFYQSTTPTLIQISQCDVSSTFNEG